MIWLLALGCSQAPTTVELEPAPSVDEPAPPPLRPDPVLTKLEAQAVAARSSIRFAWPALEEARAALATAEPDSEERRTWSRYADAVEVGNDAALEFQALCKADHAPSCAQIPLRSALQKACDLGYTRGCSKLGEHLAKADLPAATALFRQACEAGEPLGCHQLGRRMADGTVDGGAVKGLGLLRRACEGGASEACATAAGKAAAGLDGLPVDVDGAVEDSMRGCSNDHVTSCAHLVLALRIANAPENLQNKAQADLCRLSPRNRTCPEPKPLVGLQARLEALASAYQARRSAPAPDLAFGRLALAAEAADSPQRALWARYIEALEIGDDTRMAKAAGRKIYAELCTQDLAPACVRLFSEVATRKACDLDYPNACAMFGSRYLKDDPAAAAELFRNACERMDAQACSSLGQLMLTKAIEGGASEGLALQQKACSLGDGVACYTASLTTGVAMYGIAEDLEAALADSTAGCELGYDLACSSRVMYLEATHASPKLIEAAVATLCAHKPDDEACKP